MDTTIDDFVTLFRGRGDCYGSENGGCIRQRLTKEVFVSHLQGETGIGVYPAVPGEPPFCVWGCVDIDTEDLGGARLIQRTLGAVDVASWIERSRSKGYHVWVFSSAPVSAELMRNTLLAAHQVANYPAKEVNPKQFDVSVTKVGNYVRLPYLGGLVETPSRRVILDDDDNTMDLDAFVAQAVSKRTSPERIQLLAGHYIPPPPTRTVIDFDAIDNGNIAEALAMTNRVARIIWEYGPLEGQDRSSALVRLAYQCQQSGVAPSVCRTVVADADRRWGKFHLRGTKGDEHINKIVERAYRGV